MNQAEPLTLIQEKALSIYLKEVHKKKEEYEVYFQQVISLPSVIDLEPLTNHEDDINELYTRIDMYGLSEWEVETWTEELTAYMDAIDSCSRLFLNEAADLDHHREETQEYCKECSRLSQELAARVKYDASLAVAAEGLAWECSMAAGLAEDLEAQGDELNRLAMELEEHWDLMRVFRNLLQEYLGGEEDGDWS